MSRYQVMAKFSVSLAVLFTFACASEYLKEKYVQPIGEDTSPIIGYCNKRKGLPADEKTYLLAVDGHLVENHKQSIETPILLSLGKHVLVLWFDQGVLSAESKVELDVIKSASYVIRGDTAKGHMRFWIEDAITGKTVVDTDEYRNIKKTK